MSNSDLSESDRVPGDMPQLVEQLRHAALVLTPLADALSGQPRVISEGKTPREWVQAFAEQGVEISERTLRERERALGAFRSLGNVMIMLPEHIDTVFEQPARGGL